MSEKRRVTDLVLTLAAMALGFVAQGYFAKGPSASSLRDGLILYAAAALLLIYALRRQPALALPAPRQVVRAQIAPRRRWAGLALLVASLLSGLRALRLFGRNAHIGRAWLLYLASVAFFMAAMYVLSSKQQATSSKQLPAACSLLPAKNLLLAAGILLLILLVGAFMRLYQFDSIPFGTWYDEADAGLHARRILQEAGYRPLYWTSMNHPAHLLYLYALSMRLFGDSTL
ncbi:MAG TPA: hypothetical protein EYP09_00040, partial [Anaerolineae bacterium]|nr:hypothetical protein [Anaerolineae bacterium]